MWEDGREPAIEALKPFRTPLPRHDASRVADDAFQVPQIVSQAFPLALLQQFKVDAGGWPDAIVEVNQLLPEHENQQLAMHFNHRRPITLADEFSSDGIGDAFRRGAGV